MPHLGMGYCFLNGFGLCVCHVFGEIALACFLHPPTLPLPPSWSLKSNLDSAQANVIRHLNWVKDSAQSHSAVIKHSVMPQLVCARVGQKGGAGMIEILSQDLGIHCLHSRVKPFPFHSPLWDTEPVIRPARIASRQGNWLQKAHSIYCTVAYCMYWQCTAKTLIPSRLH